MPNQPTATPPAIPDDLRIALLALRQMAAELLDAHHHGEILYEALPKERREFVDRRPDFTYREEIVQTLAFSPPATRRERRQWLVDAITNLDGILADRAGMDARDLRILQRASGVLQLMSTPAKRELERFFDAVGTRSPAAMTMRSSTRGRVTVHTEEEESG